MQQLHVASNGVPVYSYAQPHLHSFCIGLYVKAGVLYERPEESGITHFLEHVLFRNLGGMPQRELYEALETMGASFDACTYKEFVEFTITATSRHFDGCADIIARLLAPLSVSVRDVNLERRRVQNEIREDDPLGSFDYFVKRKVWGDTPVARPIPGTITSVTKIGLEHLKIKKEQDFQAQNLCFYVTGGFTDDNLLHLIRVIERYEVQRGEDTRLTHVPAPPDFMKRKNAAYLQNSKELPDVCFSFDMDVSRYAMAEMYLLDELLFRGALGRFNMALSEDTGMIYSHEAYMDQYRNIGTFSVKFSVLKSNLAEAIRTAAGVFRSMKESISDAELALHMPRYSDNYDFTWDDPDDLNWNMAFHNFILGYDLKSIEHIKSLYREVTAARLTVIAGEIFRPENAVLAVRAPKGKGAEDFLFRVLAEL